MSFDDKTYPRVVAVGEALIDMIQQVDGAFQPVPGGCPLNTAVAVARQGISSSIITPISKDSFGDMLMDHMRNSNVDTSLVNITEVPTTLAFATLDFAGHAQYTFYIDGCSQSVWNSVDIHDDVVDGNIITVSGSFALGSESMADYFDSLFKQIKSQDKSTLIFDPNVRAAVINDRPNSAIDNFDRWIKQATIVKASDEDLEWRYPERSPEDIAHELVTEHGVSLVVITLGEKGAYACTSEIFTRKSAPQISVVDTVGAGDSFNAGLIAGLIETGKYMPEDIKTLTKEELDKAIDLAIKLSSDTCRREGADSPYADETPYLEDN